MCVCVYVCSIAFLRCISHLVNIKRNLFTYIVLSLLLLTTTSRNSQILNDKKIFYMLIKNIMN